MTMSILMFYGQINGIPSENPFLFRKELFGSGHFSGREVRGKSSSVTTHRIPRNVNAMFYEFEIIQCPISQLYIKPVCEQYVNHVRASEGYGERIN